MGQMVAGDRNTEYEAEKKAEKEKEDRKNTNYLVPPQTSDFKGKYIKSKRKQL